MSVITLTNLDHAIEFDDILRRLRIQSAAAGDIRPLYESAMALARPCAVLSLSTIDARTDNSVTINGTEFLSRVLAVNLQGVTAVVPYVITSGRELYDAARAMDDPVEQYYMEEISEMILGAAMGNVHETARELLKSRDIPGEAKNAPAIYAMNPGSLPDWPMAEQPKLFSLLGDVFSAIGVELTESCLMVPIKSVSGIFFASDEHYENCALCPRGVCPNRRSEFNPALYQEKYGF